MDADLQALVDVAFDARRELVDGDAIAIVVATAPQVGAVEQGTAAGI